MSADNGIYIGIFPTKFEGKKEYRVIETQNIGELIPDYNPTLRQHSFWCTKQVNDANIVRYFKDAKWFEKISTVTLIASIAGIGIAPLWLSNTISISLKPIIEQLTMNFVK